MSLRQTLQLWTNQFGSALCPAAKQQIETMLSETPETAVVDFATELVDWLFYERAGKDWGCERAQHPDLDYYAYRSMRIMQAANGGRRLT